MAWCGCSRKERQCRASSDGGVAGGSVSTSTPYILWLRCSNKALRPFSGGVYGWVFCAKNWQLVGGALLLLGMVPLGVVILAPVIVHIVEFHVFLAPAGLPLAVLVATLAMFLAWTHRPAYRPLFTASVVQSAS